MHKLLRQIDSIRPGPAGKTIRRRMHGFYSKGKEPEEEIFNELCFCLLTANYSAEGAIRIQNTIGDGFHRLPQQRLAKKLKQLGYRFPNTRARYITGARKHHGKLKTILKTANPREWLVGNVLGLGYKESSHFLRNIGHDGHAIIDFHIVGLLVKHKMIEKPKTLSKKAYLGIEQKLSKLAEKAGISQGELDLYLWYLETGKILK